MKLKNLDKPLTLAEFNGKLGSIRVADYHGMPCRRWGEIHKLINSPLDGRLTNAEHYQNYLNWCEIADSPLYKALS